MKNDFGFKLLLLVIAIIVILLLFGYQFVGIKVGSVEMMFDPPSEPDVPPLATSAPPPGSGVGPSMGIAPPEPETIPASALRRGSSTIVAERIQSDTDGSGSIGFGDNRVLVWMNADGSGQTALTDGRVNARDASWAANGATLSFASDVGGDYDIYTMKLSDLVWHPLVEHSGNDRGPVWSPDGRWIAFYSDRDGDTEIYRMSADGTDLKQLTNNNIEDRYPSWSPDGRLIAYESGQCPDPQCWIHLMDWDGNNPRQLVMRRSFWPNWSPDGRYVAYSGYTEGSQAIIYRMDVQTGIEGTLTVENSTGQSWSPDGRRFAFVQWISRAPQIWIKNSDGSISGPLTSGAWHTRPVWSP